MRYSILIIIVLFIVSCDSVEDKAGRFFLKGNEALNNGEYEEAIRFYTEAIGQKADYKEAWNNRGVANYRDNKVVEAINDYTHVLIQLDPEFTDARRNRVNAYLDAGRYDKALSDLGLLQEAFPDSAFVDFTRGLVYHGMKDFEKSIEAFQVALEKRPSDPEIIINMANGYFMLKEYDKAIDLLEQAKGLDATEPNIYNTLALIETGRENYQEALELVNKAISMDGNNPYFFNNRGFVYIKLDELDKAQEDIRRAIIGAPENAWAYRNRGILLFYQKNLDGAIRNFELAHKLEENVPEVNFYWGTALLLKGDTNGLCELLSRARDLLTKEEFQNLNCL